MLRRSLFSKVFVPALLALAVCALVMCALFVNINRQHAAALSATDFNAGRIIDDSVFYNKDSMSTAEIQSFLDHLIPNCDIWGTGQSEYGGGTRVQYASAHGWPGPPYVCINKYYENPNNGETSYEKGGGAFDGGQSAAQIIYNAAQKYGINPQVILVLLKKESAGPLTQDSWPLKSQYKYAMGYACPDSGPGYSANCDSSKAGFYKQVDLAAWQLKYYKDHPNDYRYKIGWNDIQYSTDPACGTKRVYIENMATLSLYIYTPYTPNGASLANYPGTAPCGAYGNRNFFMYFSSWFGKPSTPPLTKCDSKLQDMVCVWSVRKDDGSQFLTSSETELSSAMYSYGWINEGIVFYAYSTQKPGTIPVRRLQKDNLHYFSADNTEYTTLKNSGVWSDEGIRFYVWPNSTPINTSHRVYKLRNPNNGLYYWTADTKQRDYLVTVGYIMELNAFNTPSGIIPYQEAPANRDNIYTLSAGSAYLYTTSLTEADSASRMGYTYQNVLTTANSNGNGTPVYRLYGNGEHFYTIDGNERNNAVSKYGYTDEGIKFYLDDISGRIYRLISTKTQTHRYISDTKQAMDLSNNQWKYETMLSPPTDPTPVYRFLNLSNGEHFYTIDPNEAANISNKGWQYEQIAFYASPKVGTPVYRMYGNGEHFYTSDPNERDNAVRKYGYEDEGVRFYVSTSESFTPVYRLYGNNEHFYTTSSSERNSAITKYNFVDEGVRFYLTP